MSIFGASDPLYLKFAVMYLRIYMFMVFAGGLQPFATYFFTSIGKSRIGTLLTLTRQIVLLVPLLLILPIIFGINGMMYAGPVSDGCAAILAIALMTRELKKQKAEIELKLEQK
jgi:Na+-driven multidrug efflux pump